MGGKAKIEKNIFESALSPAVEMEDCLILVLKQREQ